MLEMIWGNSLKKKILIPITQISSWRSWDLKSRQQPKTKRPKDRKAERPKAQGRNFRLSFRFLFSRFFLFRQRYAVVAADAASKPSAKSCLLCWLLTKCRLATDRLASNACSAIDASVVLAVSEFTESLAHIYEQHAEEMQLLVSNFRKKNSELRKERPACASSLFHTWETLLQEVEIDSQAHSDIASILGRQVGIRHLGVQIGAFKTCVFFLYCQNHDRKKWTRVL